MVRYLQWRYKRLTIRNKGWDHNSQVINKLKLIQHILYYFKGQYNAWGYFHPDCIWTKRDDIFFKWLFPQKKGFKEIDTVVNHNPEAITYYHNKIFMLMDKKPPKYAEEIEKQLIKWKNWN